MNINLRKASVLLSELGAVYNSFDIHSMSRVTLDQYTPVETAITNARASLLAALSLQADIMKVIYEIRKSVGKANVASGIDDLLADLAYVEKSILLATSMSELSVVDNIGQLNDRITRNIALEAAGHGFRSVQTGVSTSESCELATARVREFKREKQKLKDKLLDLNIQTKITLSDYAVNVLRHKDVDLI